jgi:hypothetical protein
MKKIILGTSAVVVTFVSVFAFTSYNKKFTFATIYTKSGIPLQYHLTKDPPVHHWGPVYWNLSIIFNLLY